MTEHLKRSQKQEARVSDMTRGSRNAGSGNGWQRKGDIRSETSSSGKFLWEMKRTSNKKQITVKVADLETIRHHAWADSRIPVFHIEIDDKRYVILQEDDFLELTGEDEE